MIDLIGGPDRDRTDDLFHAMEARSQLRHRPTFRWGQLLYFRRSGRIRQTRRRSGQERFLSRLSHRNDQLPMCGNNFVHSRCLTE